MDEEVEFATSRSTTSKDRDSVLWVEAVKYVTRDHVRLLRIIVGY